MIESTAAVIGDPHVVLELGHVLFRGDGEGRVNWTVWDLAKATGLHRNTITNIEVGRYAGDEKSLQTIEVVLRKAGVEFIEENGGGPGVRLRKRSKEKPKK